MISKSKNNKPNRLRRDLKLKHLKMIAIGSSIGTGLFITSGTVISLVGPVMAVLFYILIGIMLYLLMTGLGELTAYMPESGSFFIYGQKYVEEGFGFALGWSYWFNWAITIAVDLVAVQLVMNWWFPNIQGWIWSILFLAIIFLLNYLSVRSFGEAEYWFSLIKIVTLIFFIFFSIITIFNTSKNIEIFNWLVWKLSNINYTKNFSVLTNVIMTIGFSFQGIELIGITVSESSHPERNIPRVIRQVFWFIIFFYILIILTISLIVFHNNIILNLVDSKNLNEIPFILIFQHSGLSSIATIMNTITLIAILSAGNSGTYASTRMLYTLACSGKAPKMFTNLSHKGVPRNALYATTIVSSLCFLTLMFNNRIVYSWLLNTSSVTGFIAWFSIAIIHYRFRLGYISHGNAINNLPYRSSLFPLGPIFVFLLCLTIIIGHSYEILFKEITDWSCIIETYVCILSFLIIWFSYKLARGTHFVRYKDMRFYNYLKENKIKNYIKDNLAKY